MLSYTKILKPDFTYFFLLLNLPLLIAFYLVAFCLTHACFFLFALLIFFFLTFLFFFFFSPNRRDTWEISADDLKSPNSPTSATSPGKQPRSRTQSHLHPLNLATSHHHQNPNKSPQQAEVSPLRRWSEAAVMASNSPPGKPQQPQWQTNFERSYIELEELGRGRFSVVRRCQEIMSGNEVAVKFINRRKQDEHETLREYKYLSEMKHPNVISALGVFLTSNSYAIVMTL